MDEHAHAGIPWLHDPDASSISINPALEAAGYRDWMWWMTLSQLAGIAVWAACALLEPLVRPRCTCHRRAKPTPGSPTTTDSSSQEDDLECVPAQPQSAAPAVPPQPPQPTGGGGGTRMAAFDALKITLTFLVVLFHVSLIFVGDTFFMLNILSCPDVQEPIADCLHSGLSWVFNEGAFAVFEVNLMALYFFLAGFFTPTSFDRKGTGGFLKDRLQRLGYPLLLWFFLLMPLLAWFVNSAVFGLPFRYGEKYTWMLGGPPWFLVWLLTFSVVYAFAEGEPLNMRMPSVGVLLTCGLLTGIIVTIAPTTAFTSAPLGLAELVPCALFFAAGAIAKRNAWMLDLRELKVSTRWFLRGLAAFLIAAVWMGGVGGRGDASNYAYIPEVRFLGGFLCVVLSIASLDLFSQCFQHKGRVLQFLADGAYAVFLIHPWVMVPVAWSYVALLAACDFHVVKALIPAQAGGSGAFLIQTSNPGVLWCGWAYTLTVSVGIGWPLAYGLRKMPGLKHVI